MFMRSILLLGAVGAIAGCPESNQPQPSCKTAQDCLSGESCQTATGTCLMQCKVSADCMPGQMCSTAQMLCVPKCTKDADCASGSTCDTAAGTCNPKSTDPCNGTCTASQTCDTTGAMPVCKAVDTSCSGTGKSTCTYGQYCSASMCMAAPVATAACPNFSSGNLPAWSATSGTGPVIFETTKASWRSSGGANCGGMAEAQILVRAYRTDADWPASASGLQAGSFFYVNVGGQETDVISGNRLVPVTGYVRDSANPRNATFTVFACPPMGASSLPVGLYFKSGNPICTTISQ